MATNSVVKMNYDAAYSDIDLINAAIERLNQSLNSLTRLKNDAASMHGETGQAIVDQSTRLINDINKLINNLRTSAGLVQKTVYRYQEEDKALASEIRNQ